MNTVESSTNQIGTATLCEVLEPMIQRRGLAPQRIVHLARTPCAYMSSFPLEVISVHLEDGSSRELVFKNTSSQALSLAARQAKPHSLDNPRREIIIYRSVLDPAVHGSAFYYGSVVDDQHGRYWLFLEKVPGRELYQVGEFNVWRQAAAWLATLHQQFSRLGALPPDVAAELIRYDSAYFHRWLQRAADWQAANPQGLDGERKRQAAHILRRYAGLTDELAALPETVIHGELYASNVMVRQGGEPPRICFLDWERAGLGAGLIDLAALTAGSWTENQKLELAMAYYAALPAREQRCLGTDDFIRHWMLCRLHWALQWLVWSANWSPPEAHRQDWLAEAVQVAGSIQA